ncbi:MAG: OmpA family protein [Bacteroidota bacterium]
MKLFNFILLSLFAMPLLQAQINGKNNEIIVKNEAGVNSENQEYAPVFYKEGLVFTTTQNDRLKYAVEDTRIGQNVRSIWKAVRNGEGELANAEPLAKELMTDMHESAVAFNSTGEVIYFTRNDKRETSQTSGSLNLKQLNIYSAQLVDGRWTNITKMPFNEDGYNTKHPTLHPDEEELYFSSDRPGGYGNYDLYVIRKIGGEWSSPINLGPQVNTPSDEAFPFIHPNNTLYFSSNGHAGMGKADLYYTTKNREIWRRPTNMGEPFNSSSDDLALILDRDQKNGYFSSDRSGGQGSDDIYSFKVEGAVATGGDEILVTVIDGISNQSIEGAVVKYINLNEVILGNGSETITLDRPANGQGSFSFKVDSKVPSDGTTDAEGKYILSVPEGQYALKVSKEGYVPYQLLFDVPSNTNDNNTYIVPLDKAVDCVPLSGVISANGTPQSGVNVIIRDESSGEEFTAITDGTGKYDGCLKCGRKYKVYAQKGQSSSGSLQISTNDQPCNGNFVLDNQSLDLNAGAGGFASTTAGGGIQFVDENGNVVVGAPVKVGSVILLPNIYYNFNDADLRPDAMVDLDLVKKMLDMYPSMEIQLVSHTDSRGGDSYNQALSERRSNRAVEYLLEMGVDANRVTPVGMGERKPRNRCVNGRRCSEVEHQENRRTEVVVVDLGDSFSSSARDDDAINTITEYVEEDKGGTDVQDDNYDDFDGGSDSDYNFDNSGDDYSSNDDFGSTSDAGADRPFYVIAGTFRSNNNAQGRLTEVQDMGFYNAEVIQFDYPSYHAVCVDKFSSESDARSLVSRLQSQYGVDSYVRRME